MVENWWKNGSNKIFAQYSIFCPKFDFLGQNRRKHRFCGWKEVPIQILTQKSSKTSILRFERGTNSIFDPKIIENIDFAVGKRYQFDF